MTRTTRAFVLIFLIAATAAAQEPWYRGYGYGYNRVPPRLPRLEMYDGAFQFCRGLFTSVRREASGSGWSTDYPDADVNFSIRFAELTKTRVSKQSTGDPNHVVVPLMDPYLFQCPYIHMEDAGTARFSDEEIEQLRAYLFKGGFIWVDDSWGSWALEQWEKEIGRVLPPHEFPIRDIPLDHPLFRSMFQITKFPQIPAISHWRRFGPESTSERGADSEVPMIRGITDLSGNLMVLMTHNTDISDAWEREGEDPRYFYQFSPDGYAMGLNIVLYAMSH